jgi:hypothetical protein
VALRNPYHSRRRRFAIMFACFFTQLTEIDLSRSFHESVELLLDPRRLHPAVDCLQWRRGVLQLDQARGAVLKLLGFYVD